MFPKRGTPRDPNKPEAVRIIFGPPAAKSLTLKVRYKLAPERTPDRRLLTRGSDEKKGTMGMAVRPRGLFQKR